MTPRSAAEMRELAGLRPFSLGFRAISQALRGLPLTPAEREAFLTMSGGVEPRDGVGFDDVLLIKPRRGGGTEWLSNELAFEGAYVPHGLTAAPGQTIWLPGVCARRDQAREIRNYIAGLFSLPLLAHLVEGTTSDEIKLTTGVAFRITTADVNAVSSITAGGYGLSEFAKWPGEDSAEPDRVIIDALDPATAPIAGAPTRRRLRETSAFIQEGIAFEMDRDFFGKAEAPTLVLRGSFALLNPNIDRAWLEQERKKKTPTVFAREYGPDFDKPPEWQAAAIESWFGADVIDGCVDKGRGTLEPSPEHTYFAASDLGLRVDGTALAIAHREQTDDDRVVTVIDGVWYWPPRSTTMGQIIVDASRVIRKYGAGHRAFADQFHFDSVKDDFAREGITLKEAPWTSTGGRNKTIRFNSVRVLMIDGNLRLPDDRDLLREFHNLAGRLRRTGTEELSARTGHDDRLHAAVLVASEIMEEQPHRAKWPGTWTFEDYLEHLPGLQAGPFRGTAGTFNDLLYYGDSRNGWFPVGYSELRRRVAAWKKSRRSAA
jgi:hypothetical protein